MLRNKECFDFLESYRCDFLGCDEEEVICFSPELLCYCSPFPIRNQSVFGNYLYYTSYDAATVEPYNGLAKFLFTSVLYNYQNGIKSINTINCTKSYTFDQYLSEGFEQIQLPDLNTIL